MAKLDERSMGAAVDNETFERVYELLEEHTFSWVTDAWKRTRRANAITFAPCARSSVTRRVEWSDEQFDAIVYSCARLASENVVINVGDVACVVPKLVAAQLRELLVK